MIKFQTEPLLVDLALSRPSVYICERTFRLSDHSLDTEIIQNARARLRSHLLNIFLHTRADCGGQSFGVARGDDHADLSDNQSRIARIGDDTGYTTGHRFTNNVRETFAV
jgi:hypothetical protein